MTIRFNCKRCGFDIKAKEKSIGKTIKCPNCDKIKIVPKKLDKITFRCKTCGHKISVALIQSSKKGKCPNCQNIFSVPGNEPNKIKSIMQDSSILLGKIQNQYQQGFEDSNDSHIRSLILPLMISGVAFVVVGYIIWAIAIRPSTNKPDILRNRKEVSAQSFPYPEANSAFNKELSRAKQEYSTLTAQLATAPAATKKYYDSVTSYFTCEYPSTWQVKELDDIQNRRVQFLSEEAEIRVRVIKAQGKELPDSDIINILKETGKTLFPKNKGTLISEKTINVDNTLAYQMEYMQNNPRAHTCATMFYVDHRMHILMFAATNDNFFRKWSDEFHRFLDSYKAPITTKVASFSSSSEKGIPIEVSSWKEYIDPQNRFVCKVPLGWRIAEERGSTRSKVTFLSSFAEIGIIARDTNRHTIDESDRQEMIQVQQSVVNKAKSMGGQARLIAVEWAEIKGIKALKSSIELIRPERVWYCQMKFKQSGYDHCITLTVKSHDKREEMMKLFENFLSFYQKTIK